MKIILISILVLAGALLSYIAFRPTGSTPIKTVGSLGNIEESLRRLRSSDNPSSFLVIYVDGSGDFIQLDSNGQTFQLDYPLITDRQRTLREVFETVYKELGLVHTVNFGSDGSEFLDCELNGEIDDISSSLRTVLSDVFGVEPSTKLLFEFQG